MIRNVNRVINCLNLIKLKKNKNLLYSTCRNLRLVSNASCCPFSNNVLLVKLTKPLWAGQSNSFYRTLSTQTYPTQKTMNYFRWMIMSVVWIDFFQQMVLVFFSVVRMTTGLDIFWWAKIGQCTKNDEVNFHMGLYLLRNPATGCCVTTVSFVATIFSYGGANGGGAYAGGEIIEIFTPSGVHVDWSILRPNSSFYVKKSKL